MKKIALTFTCPRDAVKAAYLGAASFFAPSVRRIWCVESKHADMPIPTGVERLVVDFNRGRSLRGTAAIAGIAEVYGLLADQADALIKIDSDTLLLRPSAFWAPIEAAYVDFVYIRRYFVEGRLLANGNCYALSRRGLERASCIDAEQAAKKYDGHEDKCFSTWLLRDNVDLTSCQIDRTKCHWHITPYAGRDLIAAHFGYESTDAVLARARAALAIHGCSLPDMSEYEKAFKDWRISNA